MNRFYKSKLYHYLLPFIEKGASEEDLLFHTERFQKQQRAAWQRNKRAAEKQFTISLTKEEVRIIDHAAKGHKKSKTKFIKQSALAYCTKSFLILDEGQFRNIEESLKMNYALLQQLMEEHNFSEKMRYETLEKMEHLIETLLNTIQRPRELTNWISEHQELAE
jgi:uncharacterized protein (DUF1778 family)